MEDSVSNAATKEKVGIADTEENVSSTETKEKVSIAVAKENVSNAAVKGGKTLMSPIHMAKHPSKEHTSNGSPNDIDGDSDDPTPDPPLLLSSASAEISPPCSLPVQLSTGRPEPRNSSPKQIAIPRFSRLPDELRSTLLDLILGRRFLRGSWGIGDYKALSHCCRWLSIVQSNRSCSDIFDDVSVLVKMELVRLSVCGFCSRIDASYFRVFDKFVKKVIRNNPSCDTHRYVDLLDDTNFMSAGEFSVPERIRVLKLDGCRGLKSVDFSGLQRLRSLFIISCPVLKELTGWKFLRELGWLEINFCPSLQAYPDLQNLPSLKEFRVCRRDVSNCPPRSDLGISHCAQLRTLEVHEDNALEETGDLSTLKCLEVLNFTGCCALATITGLSGLHSLTSLKLMDCEALSRLPDMSHMKQLSDIDVSGTGLEEIPGVEKLVSLEILDCENSKLKNLPDLRHLPALREVWLGGTPLVEDDSSSSYFGKAKVLFDCEETRRVDVSDISETEHNLSDLSDEEDYEESVSDSSSEDDEERV